MTKRLVLRFEGGSTFSSFTVLVRLHTCRTAFSYSFQGPGYVRRYIARRVFFSFLMQSHGRDIYFTFTAQYMHACTNGRTDRGRKTKENNGRLTESAPVLFFNWRRAGDGGIGDGTYVCHALLHYANSQGVFSASYDLRVYRVKS